METVKKVVIKSYNGIGDLLFVTPTLRRIKEKYGSEVEVVINTNYPELVEANPFVDRINESRDGIFLGYPDPIHRQWPDCHHIISDWKIVRDAYLLDIEKPELKPEIHMTGLNVEKKDRIGVQVLHKGHWNQKKVWPKFGDLVRIAPEEYNLVEIPLLPNVRELVKFILSCKAVVCAEGGVSHIARAFDVPAIVIYGGFANPEWNGYKEQINIVNQKWCSWCYNPSPCKEKVERLCMKEITVEQILHAIKGLEKIHLLSGGDVKRFVETDALKWCKGKGVDVGAGRWCLPGARPIYNGPEEDAYCIGEADNSLDFVFSSHCLEHLEEPSRALKEWYRILKPEGILYLYTPNPDYLPWRKKSMPKWHKWDLRKEDLFHLLGDFEIIEFVEKDEYCGTKIIARKGEGCKMKIKSLRLPGIKKNPGVIRRQCPGGKIRSHGRGKGLGRGKGRGPMGRPNPY